MKERMLRCRFASNGCKEKFKVSDYGRLIVHEHDCKFRDVKQ